MRIGLLKQADAVPVIMAQELGLFATEGIEVDLSVKSSWANIADKLAHGFLDAAVIVPPLAFAMALGLRGPASGVLIPQSLSLGGSTVTLETSLVRHIAAYLASGKWTSLIKARAFAAALKDNRKKPTLAVAHQYSTQNLLLRYWLAAGGIDPDVTLTIVPPAQMVEALRSGRIAGFCAGAPWGAIAEKSRLGTTITTSRGIWRNGPEKALAVNQAWAEANPGRLQAAQRALLRAAQFCDAPQNSALIVRNLSADAYLGLQVAAGVSSLSKTSEADSDPFSKSLFFRNAATVPWHSHALWFLEQMARWGLIPANTDFKGVAERVYRPDLYAAAAPKSANLSVPSKMFKTEGHAEAWRCAADPSPIDMEPDGFCDGGSFAAVTA